MLKRYCYLAFYFLWYQVQKNGCRNVKSRRLHIFCVSQPPHFMRYVWKTLHYVWWCIFFVCTVCTRTLRSLLESGSMSHKNTQTHTSSMVLCSLPGSQILTHKTSVFHSNVNATCENERCILDIDIWVTCLKDNILTLCCSHVVTKSMFSDPFTFMCSVHIYAGIIKV